MASSDDKRQHELGGVRDTVESIWVAIVLAFVLRAFMIEAFVIPTGSMAPRLFGEHLDLRCPECGYSYAFGLPRSANGVSAKRDIRAGGAICPNCRAPYKGKAVPARSGDRVLVLKYLYRLGDLGFASPRPWDVVVFRNPQNNRENYIKRLVGLPGETIEIIHGDVFVAADGGPPKIRRKPPRAQRAMWQVVFDNDYQPSAKWLSRRVGPEWASDSRRWTLDADGGRNFAFAGGAEPARVYLRADASHFRPHYGYNPAMEDQSKDHDERDVCGDLKLSLTFVPQAEDSRISLGLTSMEHHFKAELSCDGQASLWYSSDGENWDDWGRRRLGGFDVDQACRIALTHVDMQVTFWVDDEPVLSSSDERYPASYESLKRRLSRAAGDNWPIPAPQVAITAAGGPCRLEHVRVFRDVFYTRPKSLAPTPDGPLGNFARTDPKATAAADSGPRGVAGNPVVLKKFPDQPELDQFFVLGDNSPQSLDGRAWTSAAPTLRFKDAEGNTAYRLGTVPRYNLIGKAMFVYWPAGYPLPGLRGLPIIPNVGRMRLIR